MGLSINPQLLIAAILGLLSGATHAEVAEAIPESVLSFWEHEWRLEVDELITDLSTKFGKEFLSDASSEDKSAFVSEMKRAIESEVTWESRGKQTVERLLNKNCGSDLLARVAPYHRPEKSSREMPADLLAEYAECSSNVRLDVNLEQITAITDVARESYPYLFEKYGVDPGSN